MARKKESDLDALVREAGELVVLEDGVARLVTKGAADEVAETVKEGGTE